MTKKQKIISLTVTIMVVITVILGYKICTKVDSAEVQLTNILKYDKCEYDINYKVTNSKDCYTMKISGIKNENTISLNMSDTNSASLADIILYNNDLYVDMGKVSPYIVDKSKEYGKYFKGLEDMGYVLFNDTTISEIETLYSMKNNELECMKGLGDKTKNMKEIIIKELSSASHDSNVTNIDWVVAALHESCSNTVVSSLLEGVSKSKLSNLGKNNIKIELSRNDGTTFEIELKVKKLNEAKVMVPNKSINLVDFTSRLMENYIKLEGDSSGKR